MAKISKKTCEALLPHIKRKLKVERVKQHEHKKAISALRKCVLGQKMVKVYMQINGIYQCHNTIMTEVFADDGCEQVVYLECKHCGHTKEVERYLAG